MRRTTVGLWVGGVCLVAVAAFLSAGPIRRASEQEPAQQAAERPVPHLPPAGAFGCTKTQAGTDYAVVKAFVRAYDERDAAALAKVFRPGSVFDPAAVIYAGDARPAPADWLSKGWAVSDTVQVTSFCSYPVGGGEVHLRHSNALLAAHGVASVTEDYTVGTGAGMITQFIGGCPLQASDQGAFEAAFGAQIDQAVGLAPGSGC